LCLALGTLSVAIVLRSLPGLPLLWFGTAAIGASIAIMNVLLPPLIKRDFPENIGRITGMYTAVQSSVAALASAIAVPVAGSTSIGWRLALGLWSGLSLFALGLFLWKIVPRAGSNVAFAGAFLTIPRRSALSLSLRAPWKTALGWRITLFSGSQALFFYTILTWWPMLEQESGVSKLDAGWHQGLLQAAMIAASILAGVLLHRLGSNVGLAVVISAALTIIGLLGQIILPNAALAWVLLLGLGTGGTFVVSLSLLSLRTVNPIQTARLSALSQTVGYALAAVGIVAAGILAEVAGSWGPTLLVLLALQCIQLVLGLSVARPALI
jgi:CP family cyanate transporter-like MFS transporter